MPNPVLQPSLAGGEMAPSLWARVDMARYTTSLKTCRNFISQVYGGAKNRPGTKLMAEAKYVGKKVRLIPFVFNSDQAYVLELGDRYLRAYTDGAILSGVTNKPNYGTMNPVDTGGGTFQITASMDTFVPGDVSRKLQVYISKLDVYTITSVVNSKVVNATSTANLSGLTYSPSDAWMFVQNPAGQVVFETSTPWSHTQLADLVYTQSADVVTVCHPEHPPQDIRRLEDGTFQVQSTLIVNGPFLDTNLDSTIAVAASAVTGTVTLTASKPIFRANHVGVQFYLEQVEPGTLWAPGKTVSAGNIWLSDGKYYKAMASGTTGTIAPTHYDGSQSDGAVTWLYVHSGFGTAKITAVGALTNGFTNTATAQVNGQLPSATVASYINATVTAYAISPANPNWVRATTSAAHTFTNDAMVNYTAV